MKALRGLSALAFVVAIAQSCTNDFDKFEVGAGGSGATAAGTSRGGNPVNTGGTTTPVGGTTSNTGGDTSAAGADAAGAPPVAGAAGAGGAACEFVTETDVLHCGECDRACGTDGVAALECSSGACTSSCALGFANCSQPATGADDGCETDVSEDPDQCGSCDNACPDQFVCSGGLCACDNSGDCGNGGGVDCVSGSCECDNVLCRPGETCRSAGGDRFCSCNDSTEPGCGVNQYCCAAGCTDIDALNCGACGRSCTSGFVCAGGACECDSDEDCGDEPVVGAGGSGGSASDGGASGSPTGVGGSTGGAGNAAAGGDAGNASVGGAGNASAGGAGNASGAGGDASPLAGAGGMSEPNPNVACVAGRCVCSGSTCGEGQRCLPSGSCG